MRYKKWSKERQHYLYQKYPQSFTPTISFWFASCFTKSETKWWGRAGFTLIELLVVVSIIGILAAILLPALSGARQRAQKIACISNLRQIGMSFSLYADDYNGLYPFAAGYMKWGKTDPGFGTYGWMEQLYPYVSDKKLYSCPANREFPDYSYFLGTRAAYIAAGSIWTSVTSVDINKIRYPTSFVLAGDTTTGGETYGFPESFYVDDCDKDDYVQNCVGGMPGDPVWRGWKVHMGGQNILFADNHVNWYQGYVEGAMTFRYDKMHGWDLTEDEMPSMP